MRGDFVLSSGQRSSFYLDARLVTLSARGSYLVAQVLLPLVQASGAVAVAGLTLGADPIVSAITTLAGQQKVDLDGLIVRARRKEHGAGRRVEGPLRPGSVAAVVDDTLTTGGSALEAALALKEAGVAVRDIFALIDREQGARSNVEAAGYRFHAVFGAREVLGDLSDR
jgi:orotate phosphoribosyltransferase